MGIVTRKSIVATKPYRYELLYDKCFETEIFCLLEQIDKGLLKVEHCYKDDLYHTVLKTSIENKSCVIKRYNFKSRTHRIKLQFRKSYGYRSFRYSGLFNQLGIPTIKPLAVIQKKKGCFNLESYFISKCEEGMSGCLYFKDDSSYKATWLQTIKGILNTTKLLQENNIYHGDYHLRNFLIVNTIPLLIDFDRIKQNSCQKKFQKLHHKDILSFNRHLMRNPLALIEFQKIQTDIPNPFQAFLSKYSPSS